MRLIHAYIFLLLCSAASSQAQITVTVLDENSLPLPYANTELKYTNGKASNFIVASNEEGIVKYENVPPENYYLVVQYISYKTDTIHNIQVTESREPIDLGSISLELVSEKLNEFEVSAIRPVHIIKANGDRAWSPPKQMALNNEDVIKMIRTIPGVTIDLNSNTVKVNGKEAQVLINGRSFFNDKEVILGYIASLTPTDIKEIEIIQSTNVKYDAQAAGGVININTNKTAITGINGYIYSRYRQGNLGSSRNKANLNWKHKRFSGTVFYQFDYYQGMHDIQIQRNITNPSNPNEMAFFNEQAEEEFAYLIHKPKFLLNFDVNSNNRIGVQLDFRNQSIDFPSYFKSYIGANEDQVDTVSIYDSQADEVANWPAVNVNYSSDIKGKGGVLDIAYDYFYKDLSKLSHFDASIYNSDQSQLIDEFIFRRDNKFRQPVHAGSIDYTKDLKRSIGIDVGVKATILEKRSKTAFDDKINGEFVNNYNKSDAFDYSEYVYAAYLNWRKLFNGWKLNMGLRLEFADVKQNYFWEESMFQTTGLNYFPSINFYKKYGNGHSFRMGYNRGLSRPTLTELFPFTTEISPYLIVKGDPSLEPQIDNILGVEFIVANDYSFYANYNVANNSINSIFNKESETVYSLTYANFERSHFFNLGASAGTDINEWWAMSADINFYYDLYNAKLDNQAIKRSGAAINFDVYSQFSLPKEFYVDLIGSYASPRYSSIELFKSGGQLDVGITKHFFKNQMTVKIQVLDVLKTKKTETSSNYLDLNTFYLEYADTRRFDLTVTYRFKNGLKFNNPKNTQSNLDIIQRSR